MRYVRLASYIPRLNRTIGIVTILIIVVTNVVKETRSGSVPNCIANIVVLAAAGIEACIINTLFNKVLIGRNDKIIAAKIGETIIRMKVTDVT